MSETLSDLPKVPHISRELAEHLKEVFSADRQINEGLLRDPNVVRSESYLLGFLAGLAYCASHVQYMVDEQDGKFNDDNLGGFHM